jgi:HemY protein
LIKVLWFLFKVMLIVGAAIWVADRSGRVSIEWQDVIVETSTALLAAAVALLVAVTFYLTRLVDTLRTTPRIYRMHKALRHQRQGQKLLSQALDAISLDKKHKATGLLKRAEKLLGPSHIVDMIKNRTLIEEKPMASSVTADFSSPYAWREAIEQQLRGGHTAEARMLAERFAKKHASLALPKKLLCDIYLLEGEWDKALASLDALRLTNTMSRKDIRLIKAAIFAERARVTLQRAHFAEGFEWAMQSDRLHPKWVPALLQAVQALAGQDKQREAASLIAQSWSQSAHDQLADAFLNLRHFKNNLARAQEAEKLVRKAPGEAASHWLLLNAFLAARLFGQARHHAMALISASPSRKVYNALARLEEAENNNRIAAATWRKKAEETGPDLSWVCKNCKQPHVQWQAHCHSCKNFNSFEWSRPLFAAGQIEKKPA